MEKKYLCRFILGIAIMASGILSTAFFDIGVLIPIVLFNMGLIIFVATALRLFRRGDLPDRDERTKKLAAYGITYSWLADACCYHGPFLGSVLRDWPN